MLLSVREAREVVLRAGMMSFGITDWGELFALCSKQSCSKQSHFDAVFESTPAEICVLQLYRSSVNGEQGCSNA